ncbi:2-hydroxyacid dehydrogenase [Geosporobacter ferrireducens]|uniref:Hydroxyacid dehydrogenase n=1 Tax=Geosporobacter ferrireducens TaxID=1424294 RepID=A0A1D8GJL5_9FIRM|nr:2-hydroxyacid dehydrogenase [Geosporobacter ferrireducens]AOT71094.1 hydroxyacid dehydrogenase [Geosporobacter ferrireducens]MTI57898.1 hydroxyacid dehydrogenase [Geosporobacter ferrireducens]
MRIKLLEPLGVDRKVIDELSSKFIEAGHEFTYYNEKTTDIEELKKRSEDADVLMIANNPLPNEAIKSAENLKMLSVAFIGIDHVGQEECKKKDVIISNAAGYCDQTVAELVIGLAINVLRNMKEGDAATRNGKTIAGLIGNEISGKTVGIVGTGRIGRRTAALFKAFNCDLLGYDAFESEEAKEMDIKYVSIENLLKESDIVSLHLPLTSETRGFMNAEKLSLMKETAILINAARGPVVDNKALADALNENKIAGAGLDVFDMEPPIPEDYPLLHAKNAVLTPHVAYASEESIYRRAKITFDNVYAWLEGTPKNTMKY